MNADTNPKQPGSTEQTAADAFTPTPEVQRNARADSDRMSRSLVKDLPVGAPKPANQR